MAAGLASLVAAPAARALEAPSKRPSRLILLGTGGGPTPKANRSAPASVIVVDAAAYVIDCGMASRDNWCGPGSL